MYRDQIKVRAFWSSSFSQQMPTQVSAHCHPSHAHLVLPPNPTPPSLSLLEKSTLDLCPSLLGPYLRTFPAAMLESRPTYRLIQTYSLLSVVLREVPVAHHYSASAVGSSHGAGVESAKGGGRAGEALLCTVMPMALSKKEFTKGVLSGNSLLQVGDFFLGEERWESLVGYYFRALHDAEMCVFLLLCVSVMPESVFRNFFIEQLVVMNVAVGSTAVVL